jgi:hypothetical protein
MKRLSMTRRRLLMLSALLLLPLVGIGVHWVSRPKPAVTLDNFTRLHKGMSREQVFAIFGQAASWEPWSEGKDYWYFENPDGHRTSTVGFSAGVAYGGHFFDSSGNGGEGLYVSLADDPGSMVDRIRRWVKESTGW